MLSAGRVASRVFAVCSYLHCPHPPILGVPIACLSRKTYLSDGCRTFWSSLLFATQQSYNPHPAVHPVDNAQRTSCRQRKIPTHQRCRGNWPGDINESPEGNRTLLKRQSGERVERKKKTYPTSL